MSHGPSEITRGPSPSHPKVTPDNNGSRSPANGSIFVSETFRSRQGEGKLTGTESYFIRASGCNLRCWFCDTPYASWKPSGESVAIDKLVDAASASGLEHVVITGGEPLLSANFETLVAAFQSDNRHVTIETAGTLSKPTPCDLLSLSPKLSDSTPDAVAHPRWSRLHEQRRMPIEIMRQLIDAARDFQLKFVVGDSAQFGEVVQVAGSLGVSATDVFIMPRGTTIVELDAAATWLRPWVDSVGFHYCDRMQIRWYGNRRIDPRSKPGGGRVEFDDRGAAWHDKDVRGAYP
ncbi:MAG: 7-carboxy-7-deazaguanine synthase QueE, partial [Planctomycetota bacterium]